jgi:hypothetical protein
MVGPAAKREAVAHLRDVLQMSECRACTLVAADRKMIRYRSRPPRDAELRSRLRIARNGFFPVFFPVIGNSEVQTGSMPPASAASLAIPNFLSSPLSSPGQIGQSLGNPPALAPDFATISWPICWSGSRMRSLHFRHRDFRSLCRHGDRAAYR